MNAPQDDALAAAAQWIAASLTGTAATATAVLAIAAVGLLTLGGRLPLRRGASVVLGCCILFSAATIAAAFTQAAEPTSPPEPLVPPGFAPASPAASAFAPAPYDPYGGVAVPGGAAPVRDLP